MTALTMTQGSAAESPTSRDDTHATSRDSRRPRGRTSLPREASTWRERLASACCAVAVSGVLAAGGFLVAAVSTVDPGTHGWFFAVGWIIAELGILGIPAAALLGWAFGPRAGWGAPEELDPLAVRVDFLAVLIGAVTIAVAELVASVATDSPGWFGPLGGFMFTLILGVIVCFLGTAATIPASMAWIALYRRVIAGRPASRTNAEIA